MNSPAHITSLADAARRGSMCRAELRRNIESFVDGYLRARAQSSVASITSSTWGLTVRYGPGMNRSVEHFVTEMEAGFNGAQLSNGDWLTLFGEERPPQEPTGLVARPRPDEFFMASDLDALSLQLDAAPAHFVGAPIGEPATPHSIVFRHELGGQTVASICCATGLDNDVVVDRLATDPAWRGRGMARSLLQAATAWALARDRARMILIASLDGHRLYRRLGFETVCPVRVLSVERKSGDSSLNRS